MATYFFFQERVGRKGEGEASKATHNGFESGIHRAKMDFFAFPKGGERKRDKATEKGAIKDRPAGNGNERKRRTLSSRGFPSPPFSLGAILSNQLSYSFKSTN